MLDGAKQRIGRWEDFLDPNGPRSVFGVLCKPFKRMAGTTGLEPAASAVTGQRSNQLNYVPTPLFQTLTSVPDFRGGIFGCKRRNRSMTRARCGSVLRRSALRIAIHRGVLVL